jgi:hypothetical protein
MEEREEQQEETGEEEDGEDEDGVYREAGELVFNYLFYLLYKSG